MLWVAAAVPAPCVGPLPDPSTGLAAWVTVLVTVGSVEPVAPARAVGVWLATAGGAADGGVAGWPEAAEARLWVGPPAVGPVMEAVLVTALVTVWTGPTGTVTLAGALAGAGCGGWLADAWLVADDPLPWLWLPTWPGLWVRPCTAPLRLDTAEATGEAVWPALPPDPPSDAGVLADVAAWPGELAWLAAVAWAADVVWLAAGAWVAGAWVAGAVWLAAGAWLAGLAGTDWLAGADWLSGAASPFAGA